MWLEFDLTAKLQCITVDKSLLYWVINAQMFRLV